MAAQPANTDISIYLAVRSYRQGLRQESVAALIKRLRPLIQMIPGNEILVSVLTRDTTTKDFSSYMGQASYSSGRGFPIVIGLNDQVSFAKAQTTIPSVDFAFQIGTDKFIKNTLLGLTTDFYANARAVTADVSE